MINFNIQLLQGESPAFKNIHLTGTRRGKGIFSLHSRQTSSTLLFAAFLQPASPAPVNFCECAETHRRRHVQGESPANTEAHKMKPGLAGYQMFFPDLLSLYSVTESSKPHLLPCGRL